MLNGRLADPDSSLATDPRADRRMVASLAQLGLDKHQPAAPVDSSSPLEAQLEFLAATESAFGDLFAALNADVGAVSGVERAEHTIEGVDGNAITLFVHRPAQSAGPVPCLIHLHAGGMAITGARTPLYVHVRDELAAAGAVVLGVEFRNSAGALGAHTYPAALHDAIAAVRWANAHLDELGASHVVLTGESGGGNLTLATTLTAKRDGWLSEIAGVYAQCPYISDAYDTLPDDLPSLRENDNYFITTQLLAILANTYDPDDTHADDPTCWPLRATTDDLSGLPPHVISVNELDPMRDEGLAYYRKLTAAGVPAVGRIVAGTVHGGDLIFVDAIPDVHQASISDVVAFARSVGPNR